MPLGRVLVLIMWTVLVLGVIMVRARRNAVVAYKHVLILLLLRHLVKVILVPLKRPKLKFVIVHRVLRHHQEVM